MWPPDWERRSSVRHHKGPTGPVTVKRAFAQLAAAPSLPDISRYLLRVKPLHLTEIPRCQKNKTNKKKTLTFAGEPVLRSAGVSGANSYGRKQLLRMFNQGYLSWRWTKSARPPPSHPSAVLPPPLSLSLSHSLIHSACWKRLQSRRLRNSKCRRSHLGVFIHRASNFQPAASASSPLPARLL